MFVDVPGRHKKIWNDGPAFEDFMGSENAPPVARRHLANGGKGGGGTTNQQQTTTIPPDVLARYNAVNTQAEQAAQQPFQTYTGQFVAPINPVQQQAIGNIGDISNAYGPYYGGATASTLAGAAAGAPYYGAAGQNIAQAQAGAAPYQQLATQFGLAGTQAVDPQALQTGQYMSPYIQSVVNPTMAALYQQQQQEQSQLAGNLATQGAFGGDRGAIQQANLARQQGLAAAQTEGSLYNQAYNNALAAAQQQQGVNLGAQQSNRTALQQFVPQALGIGQQGFAQGLGTAQNQQSLGTGIIGAGTSVGQALAGYGQGLTQTGLAANQALLAGGTLGQQTQQALNTAQYNQFLQQQGYPFQTSQFLANIAEGTGALSGSTTTGGTTAPGSWLSDERAKENIVEVGRTHDDQPIYKFNYKGEPRKQIGLIAQDVEQNHPDAVGLAGGLKTVNYDKATKDAEVHRAEGGLVPESMGGVVSPSFDRQAFADAGAAMPQYNMYDPIIQQILQQRVQAGLAGGSPYTVGGSRIPAGAMQSAGQRQLLRGSLPSLPKQQNPNLVHDAAQGISDIGTIGTGLGKGYDWITGKSDSQKPPSPTETATETAQTAGTGPGTTPPDWVAGSSTPISSDDPVYGGRRSGGRVHRDSGGDVLPYGTDSSGYVPAGETKSPSQLESEQKSMVAGLGGAGGAGGGSGGGGGGLIGGIKDAASLVGAGTTLANGAGWLMDFLPLLAAAHGGRIHRQEGGGAKADSFFYNFGNIRNSNIPWQGKGAPHRGFETFVTPEHGARAMFMNLNAYTQGQPSMTVGQAIHKWAPETENKTAAYINTVRGMTGFDPSMRLSDALNDPKAAGTLMHAMATVEKGGMPDRFNRDFFTDVAAKRGVDMPVSDSMFLNANRGLAPVTDVVDLNERPSEGGLKPSVQLTARTLNELGLYNRGGVVPRHGYEVGGAPTQVIDPDSPSLDPNSPSYDPAAAAILKRQQAGAAGVAPPLAQTTPSALQPPAEPAQPTAQAQAPAGGLLPTTPPPPPPTPTTTTTPIATTTATTTATPAEEKPGFFGRAKELAGDVGSFFERNPGLTSLLAGFTSSLGEPTWQKGLAQTARGAVGTYNALTQADVARQNAATNQLGRVQDLINVAAAQKANLLTYNQNADTGSIDKTLTGLRQKQFELLRLANVSAESLTGGPQKIAAPKEFDALPSYMNPFYLRSMSTMAGLPENTRIQYAQSADKIMNEIIAGKPIQLPNGGTFVASELVRQQLATEQAAKRTAYMAGTGNMPTDAEIRARSSQYDAESKVLADMVAHPQAHTPDQIAEQRKKVGKLKAAIGAPAAPVAVPQSTPGRKNGGRVGYQVGGAPSIDEAGRLAAQIGDLRTLVSPDALKTLEDQYNALTPEQTTEMGTKYRVNHFSGQVVPKDEPILGAGPSGEIDDTTGGVNTTPIQLPHGGAFGRDPSLPRNVPVQLIGPDSYTNQQRTMSQKAEDEFLSGLDPRMLQDNIMSSVKFSNAMKILNGAGLNMTKAEIANIMRGIGLDAGATAVFDAKDTAAAIMAGKATVDSAIQQASNAFAKPTQAEFARIAGQATATADMPSSVSSSLTARNLAMSMYTDRLNRDWLDAKARGAQNFIEFRNRWSAQHPANLFYDSATRLLGNTSGEPLPPMAKMAEGVVYVVPKNFMKNTHDENLAKHLADKGYTEGDLFYVKSKRMEDNRPIARFGKIEYSSSNPGELVNKAFEIHKNAKGLYGRQ